MQQCKRKKCGKMFEPVRHQVYCTPKCRWLDWEEKNPRVKVAKGIKTTALLEGVEA
jgi:hypothetical protein